MLSYGVLWSHSSGWWGAYTGSLIAAHTGCTWACKAGSNLTIKGRPPYLCAVPPGFGGTAHRPTSLRLTHSSLACCTSVRYDLLLAKCPQNKWLYLDHWALYYYNILCGSPAYRFAHLIPLKGSCKGLSGNFNFGFCLLILNFSFLSLILFGWFKLTSRKLNSDLSEIVSLIWWTSSCYILFTRSLAFR